MNFFSKNKSSGFTLTELLVVMAIMAVFVGVVAVNFRNGERTKSFQKAATQLVQDIRLAQGYTNAGSSINFCRENSEEANRYISCVDDQACHSSGLFGEHEYCKNGVPLGGYGIKIASTENYQIFGDKNNTQDIESLIVDYVVADMDLSLKKIGIQQFQLGGLDPVLPASDDYVTIMFEPPLASIGFYEPQIIDEALVMVPSNESELKLLLNSDNVSSTCRLVTINKISGKISESTHSCNL